MKERKSFEYSGTLELMDNENHLTNYNIWVARLLIKPVSSILILNNNSTFSSSSIHALDFGSGIGTISRVVNKLWPDICIHAVEPDQNLHKYNSSAGEVYSSIADISDDIQMDYVFSSNVLEHIPDDVNAIKNIAKKMKRGATFAIYVPAMPLLWTPMDDHVEHCRRYTGNTLRKAIYSAGLRPIEIKYVDSSGALLTLLYKAINKLKGRHTQYARPSAFALKIYDKLICPLNQLMDILFMHRFGKNLIAYCTKV